MKTQIEQLHLSSAVITVVKDGRVLYARGFGNANIAAGTPIDPETSLFRIGSITKLFTWTAVMQLVEQGKLNLDADVDTYLHGFKIPNSYPKPVTLRALMTHSAGFEDGALGCLITEDSTQVPTIAAALKQHIPARVRPPLVLSAYSNYSAALAGLIVQQVSGEPYNDYIRKHILEPLNMKYATVQEPLPTDLKADSVTGYVRADGIFVARPLLTIAMIVIGIQVWRRGYWGRGWRVHYTRVAGSVARDYARVIVTAGQPLLCPRLRSRRRRPMESPSRVWMPTSTGEWLRGRFRVSLWQSYSRPTGTFVGWDQALLSLGWGRPTR